MRAPRRARDACGQPATGGECAAHRQEHRRADGEEEEARVHGAARGRRAGDGHDTGARQQQHEEALRTPERGDPAHPDHQPRGDHAPAHDRQPGPQAEDEDPHGLEDGPSGSRDAPQVRRAVEEVVEHFAQHRRVQRQRHERREAEGDRPPAQQGAAFDRAPGR
ncbi:MAG: hypothetical protein ACLGIK_14045, partial [Gemmatimonadota bacterium]